MKPFKCDYLQLILPRIIIRSLICFMHLALGDRSLLNAAGFIHLPFRGVTNKKSDRVRWRRCKSENSQVLIDITPWSPSGFPGGKHSHSELRQQRCSSKGTVEIISMVNETFQWRGVGISNTLHLVSSVQTHLWKLASAFHPLKTWEGKINIKADEYTLCF